MFRENVIILLLCHTFPSYTLIQFAPSIHFLCYFAHFSKNFFIVSLTYLKIISKSEGCTAEAFIVREDTYRWRWDLLPLTAISRLIFDRTIRWHKRQKKRRKGKKLGGKSEVEVDGIYDRRKIAPIENDICWSWRCDAVLSPSLIAWSALFSFLD